VIVPVTIVVEGTGDVPVARKILAVAGLEAGEQHVRNGKAALDVRILAYNKAARFGPWLVLRDLDSDAPCPGALVSTLVPAPARLMRLRVAVREAEAWLLADRERIAEFLRISVKAVPEHPESLNAPKAALVNLARKSHSRKLREDMVPAPGRTVKVGPLYVARLTEFADEYWRPEVAAAASRSLSRTLESLRRLAADLAAT